jgi:integrase
MTAAEEILRSPLRMLTYRTLIALLAVTGMRIGEAIRLNRHDLDFEAGVLTVRLSKFGKSRELPLHTSTLDALHGYLRQRDQLLQRPTAPSLFISTAGTRLLYCDVHWTFLRLVRHVGLQPRSTACRPRLHDLRHSFAVRTGLTPIAPTPTSRRACRSYPPTSAMSIRPIRIGICPPRQSC